jgi:hypothetical protein
MRWLLLVALVCVTSIALCQSELIGPGRFPETREMSGMPGGSFGVLRNGTPSFRGAMALSTPIAYSLNNWHWAMGINSASPDMRFRGLDTNDRGGVSSGTAELMVGIPTHFGAVTFSVMPISVHIDENATNILFTPNQHGCVTFAAGIQDLEGNTHTFRPREPRSSRSPFVVATANPIPGGYASIGYGNQRFGGIFGNLSQTFGNFKAVAEYDTYNWNYGVANRIGHFHGFGKEIEATAFAGYIRGKYATWSLTFTF